MNNLEKEADLLARLLKENREVVINALSKFEDDEGPLRMQKMLREYFKKQRQDLQQKIEEEAQLILEIFPDVDLAILQGLLYDAGEDVMRTKTVIQQLSSKNGFKRNTNSKSSDDSPTKKQKLNNSAAASITIETNNISVTSSSTSCQPTEDYLTEKQNFHITQEKMLMEAKYDEMLQTLMDILPDADPNYIQKHLQNFSEPVDFNLFVTEALETQNYPKAKTTAKTQPVLSTNRDSTELYTTKFSVTAFLEIIPDPNTHFKMNRVLKPWTQECSSYALTALLNIYSRIRYSLVKKCFANTKSFLDACDLLDKISGTFPTSLRKFPMPTTIQNIALLQEIAYKTHYSEIMEALKSREEQYNKKIADATAVGLVLTCDCCFDDAVLLEDTFECSRNCTFCRDCIKKSVEVAFGEGKLEFNCLGDCEGQFSMQVLQAVLPSKLFSKISDKRQAEEVKAAEIENLEFCPFCDFAAIPAQENKIFNCLNPECARESCRLCKEPSHIPFRCDEVEQDENVKARTYIENKMSEAFLKKCNKCKKLYFKDNGCNMIACSCGALMCDACGKLIKNLSHFNKYGGEKSGRCPLWSDTLKSNEEKLKEVAESAKKKVNKSGQLKIDPTADIPDHFAELLTRRETASDWNKPDNFLNPKIFNKKKTK